MGSLCFAQPKDAGGPLQPQRPSCSRRNSSDLSKIENSGLISVFSPFASVSLFVMFELTAVFSMRSPPLVRLIISVLKISRFRLSESGIASPTSRTVKSAHCPFAVQRSLAFPPAQSAAFPLSNSKRSIVSFASGSRSSSVPLSTNTSSPSAAPLRSIRFKSRALPTQWV